MTSWDTIQCCGGVGADVFAPTAATLSVRGGLFDELRDALRQAPKASEMLTVELPTTDAEVS